MGTRRSVRERPSSLNLEQCELRCEDIESLHSEDGEAKPEVRASTGKRFIRRICPRVVRKFFTKWLSHGDAKYKALKDDDNQGATSEELLGLMTKVVRRNIISNIRGFSLVRVRLLTYNFILY